MSLSLDHPGWLHAQISKINGGMTVYLSAAVRETDPIYQPILDLLALVKHVLISEEMVKDVRMMFGEATLRVYQFIEDMDHPENMEGLFFPAREIMPL
jgi:Gene product 70